MGDQEALSARALWLGLEGWGPGWEGTCERQQEEWSHDEHQTTYA